MLSGPMTPPSPIEAVVFDLDGTLIDSFPDIRAACNFTLEQLGRPALSDPLIRSFVGRGSRRLVASALGVQPEDALVNEALAIFLDYYEAHPVDLTVPRPGALELIELFGARAMAICTNKPARITARVVEALGWRNQFGAVIAGGDAPALKPDPRPVELACERIGVSPHQSIMVGDGAEDVLAARTAGAFSVAVLGGFPREELVRASNPDWLVTDLFELKARLEPHLTR